MKRSIKYIVQLLVSCFLAFTMAGQVSAAVDKININTADVKQLSQLKRIGPSYASRIIEFREQNGEFQSPEEIMKVRGIGKVTFEVNKDLIIVKEEETVKTE